MFSVLDIAATSLGHYIRKFFDSVRGYFAFMWELGKNCPSSFRNFHTIVEQMYVTGVTSIPVVFAKKHKTSNVDGDIYSTTVHSFTHGTDYNVVVSSDYLTADDHVLLVDDFLANGNAIRGLVDLCGQAGAEVVGAAVAIEKRFQGGGDALREQGIRVEPLACIESMDDEHVTFCQI